MKRILIPLIGVLFVGSVALAVPADKVTICHATSSETNPWVRTVVSANATAGHFENNGTTKAGHEGDVLLQGDVDCPSDEPSPSPSPSLSPSSSSSPSPSPSVTPEPQSNGDDSPTEPVPTTLPSVGADNK